jgi:hypothetical protein
LLFLAQAQHPTDTDKIPHIIPRTLHTILGVYWYSSPPGDLIPLSSTAVSFRRPRFKTLGWRIYFHVQGSNARNPSQLRVPIYCHESSSIDVLWSRLSSAGKGVIWVSKFHMTDVVYLHGPKPCWCSLSTHSRSWRWIHAPVALAHLPSTLSLPLHVFQISLIRRLPSMLKSRISRHRSNKVLAFRHMTRRARA